MDNLINRPCGPSSFNSFLIPAIAAGTMNVQGMNMPGAAMKKNQNDSLCWALAAMKRRICSFQKKNGQKSGSFRWINMHHGNATSAAKRIGIQFMRHKSR